MSDEDVSLGLAGLRRLAIHARDMVAALPKVQLIRGYSDHVSAATAQSAIALTLAEHVLTLVIDVIAEDAVPLDQVKQERSEAAAKLQQVREAADAKAKRAGEFADQQRSRAEDAEEEAQAWQDDWTNVTVALSGALGMTEDEIADKDAAEIVALIEASLYPHDARGPVEGEGADQ